MKPSSFAQQITFLYAEDPARSWDFYENVLGLALVQDQGTCRIYATAPGARSFIGVCRARAPRASENQRVEGGVVLTLVDPDVEGWHAKLKARDANVPDKVEYSETYRVTHFFFRDPAGYLLEIQRFERPDWPEPLPAL